MAMGKKGGDGDGEKRVKQNGEMKKIYNRKVREGRKIKSVMKSYVVGSSWRDR